MAGVLTFKYLYKKLIFQSIPNLMKLESLLPQNLESGFTKARKTTGNLPGMAQSAVIAALGEHTAGPVLVICADGFEARALSSELFTLSPLKPCRYFPDWETLPYDQLSPHQDIISKRLELLADLPYVKDGFIIAPLSAIMPRLAPKEFIGAHSFRLAPGESRDITRMQQTLVSQGYLKVEQVLGHGEFAARGSILDVFPMGASAPCRIDFLDDEVDSIRAFDPETQRSGEQIKAISLLPAHEFPLDEQGISVFRSNYRDAFPGAHLPDHVIYQAISRGAIPAGIEYYLPLFFRKLGTFFDYLPEGTSVILAGNIAKAASDFDIDAHKRASMYAGTAEHPPLEPYRIFLSPKELSDLLKPYPQIRLERAALSENEVSARGAANAAFEKLPELTFDHQKKDPCERFERFAADFAAKGGRMLLTAVSEGRRQALREMLPPDLIKQLGIAPASSVRHFFEDSAPLMLTVGPFSGGFIASRQKLAFITENELYGISASAARRERRRKSGISEDALIRNLVQLKEGQLVVHVDHGIGRYRGLRTLTIGGIKGEYLAIEYQNGDMLNIPVTALSKIARYAGAENPVLSRLGTDSWSKKKQKAAEKVRDVAAGLLDLYARRAAKDGRAFNVDRRAMDEFATGFGYEETPDQAAAIEATLHDLAQSKPMDRLVCGDVGFGKTEVALRAAFAVAQSGAQVAVLVPTTILAEQHFQTFKDRFAGTALIVEELSRFKTAKEQSEAIARLADGKIDIIIGTHKLLSRQIKFKNLGLVIIDEEHRFGVRQKEKLKELRAQVDLLTLTATPIPRTLNMAMEGMRELSIIATPPEHRLAIKTFVSERSDQVVREAVMRELRRGGQVYYLHNDISTIEQTAKNLAELVPEASIGIGHGQMNERDLQKVMRDFYNQRFNLLLCTTIIENGLDVQSANTIIIDRADLLGLAQLHQIRGRVGRSSHQAYAYLFTPPRKLMTKDAKMRLDAIASIEELGAGFVLATHDLEIRGAGELLGEEQSGQIESVGFSLYTEMLNEAVKALKEGREPALADLTAHECDIDLHLPALLPDTYIADVNTRLSLYKRLSSCKTPEEFEDLKVELIDRFGFLPKSAENLFKISQLRVLAGSLGIVRISGSAEGGVIEMGSGCSIDPQYLIRLITSCRHNEYRMSGQNSLRYTLPETADHPRLQLLEQLLQALEAHRLAE